MKSISQLVFLILLGSSCSLVFGAQGFETGVHGVLGIEGQSSSGASAVASVVGGVPSRVARVRSKLQGRFDFELGGKLQIVFDTDLLAYRESGRLRAEGSAAELKIGEAYASINPFGGGATVSLGRSYLKSAKSGTWSAIVPEREFDTRRELFPSPRGSDGIVARWSDGLDLSLGVFRNVDDRVGSGSKPRAYTKDDFTAYFARLGSYFGDLELGLLAANARGDGYKAGFDFSGLLGANWELFGELVRLSTSALPRPSAAGFAYDSTGNVSGVVGLRYLDTRDSFSVVAEYLQNSGGYTSEQLQVLTALAARGGAKLPYEIANAGLLQRRYVNLSLQQAFSLDRLKFSAGLLHSLDDGGARLVILLQSELSDDLSVTFVASRGFGGSNAEMVAFGTKQSFGLALRYHFRSP